MADAKLTGQVGLPDAAVHRALNANLRLGAAENAEAVAALAANPRASEAMRIEAIEMLGAWAKPSGRDRVLAAYEHAVLERYRFFSYGDAMLLPAAPEAGA